MANYFVQTYTWNPWWNLAVEKYLADRVGEGDVVLYLWQNERTVVIGRNQNALRECHVGLLKEEGGYLARRTTGGGAVYHDLGNLCFTFAASPDSYDLERQLHTVGAACAKFGVETEFSGRNDIITKDGLKFSGNAFSNTSRCRIQHGTLMVDVDVTQMGRYLTPSKEKMKAKGVKSVKSRVCNLKDINPDITTDALRAALKSAFLEEYGDFTELDPSAFENDEVRRTYELYSSWEWRIGKSPECETSFSKRFDWGELEVRLRLNGMYISEIKVYSDALDVELPAALEGLLLGKRYDLEGEDLNKDLEGLPEERSAKLTEAAAWIAACVK